MNQPVVNDFDHVQSHLVKLFQPYITKIEKNIQEAISNLGPKNKLRDAIEYALLNGGKRFRPALVLLMAEAVGHKADVMPAALAVEFFHTASLVVDDLPCMDDEEERRNRPALHFVHGEATTLLVSYALIAAGYENLAKNAEVVRNSKTPYAQHADRICVLALENCTHNTGVYGATGGQFLDIFPPKITEENIRDIIHKKTVSLFEISFVLGWLYGGGDLKQLKWVKQAAAHFGMAFQIADDIEDRDQDLTNGRLVNMANCCGLERATQMFHEEIALYLSALKKLSLEQSALAHLAKIFSL